MVDRKPHWDKRTTLNLVPVGTAEMARLQDELKDLGELTIRDPYAAKRQAQRLSERLDDWMSRPPLSPEKSGT